MCGIAGFVTTEKGKAKTDRTKFVSQALFVNTLRGADSTGLFYIPHHSKKGESAGWLKNSLPGPIFMADKEYDKIVDDIDDFTAVVCHNRAATVGKVTANTAHPFQEGHITLVHNGTLDTTYGLPKGMFDLNQGKKEGDVKIEVDSHVICHNLATEDREKVIGSLAGAFALVWHDANEQALFIVRNDRRPLHMTQDLDSRTVYFMSEAEMLAMICKRNFIRHGPVFLPEPGVLLKFDLDSNKIKPVAKKVKLNAGVTYYNTGWLPTQQTGEGRQSRRPFTRGTTTTQPRQTEMTPHRVIPSSGIDDNDRVWIGGKMQPVPEHAQELLLDCGLFVSDRYLMRPIEAVPYRHMPSMGMVVGSGQANDNGTTTFLIHAVDMKMWQERKNDMWAVRPVAVKYEEPKKFLVICRPVALHTERSRDIVWKSLAGINTKPRVTESRSTIQAAVARSVANVSVPGPRGELVTLDQFRDAASGGCYHCGKAILIAQASDIMWVESYTRPLCKACQQDWLAANPMR